MSHKPNAYFLVEANKLKTVEEYLERTNKVLKIFSKYNDVENEFNFSNYHEDLEKNRKNELDQIIHQVKNVWYFLCSKKKLLQEKNVDVLDLRSFKKDMIEIQEKLYSLRIKLKENNEVLKDQENVLNEINETYNNKLPEWEKPLKISTGTSTMSKNAFNNGDYKEVKEFMDFVNNSNGHENGWSSEDHQLFLRLRSKYKNVNDLAINLNLMLPDICIDEVKTHEIWYKKYLHLKHKKDKAIERWRKSKTENSSQNKDSPNVDKNVIKSKIGTKTKDENIQEKIGLWKAEKEARRQREIAFEEMKKERMKQIEEEKQKAHNQLKEAVEKWRKTREIKENIERLRKELVETEEKKIRAIEANKMIKQFQSHDDIYIARMRTIKLKKNNDLTVKRSQSSYLANRDPDRILKPTKQWLLRTSKHDFPQDVMVSNFVPNIREIPKLRIPDWRKNTTSLQ